MSDADDDFYEGNPDNITTSMGKYVYIGSVKLGISNVQLTRTDGQVPSASFDVGSAQTVLPEGTAPSARLLAEKLPHTSVQGWTETDVYGKNYNKSPYENSIKPSDRFQEIAFSEALSKEIMSKDGQEGVHTIQGTMLGFSIWDPPPDFCENRREMANCVATEKKRRQEEKDRRRQAERGSRGDRYGQVEDPSETANNSEDKTPNVERQSTKVEELTLKAEEQSTNSEEQSLKARQSQNGDEVQSWGQPPLGHEKEDDTANGIESIATGRENEFRNSIRSEEPLIRTARGRKSKTAAFWSSVRDRFHC